VNGRQSLAAIANEQVIGTEASNNPQAGRTLFCPSTNYGGLYKGLPDVGSRSKSNATN